MNSKDLINELKTITPLELGKRLINPALTNKQRQDIIKLYYSLRKEKSIDKSDKV